MSSRQLLAAAALILVKNYTERIPRVDPRVVPLLLEFDTVKGVDADALTARTIDNSIVDQLLEENSFRSFSAKSFAETKGYP
jgi:hypothetical protein